MAKRKLTSFDIAARIKALDIPAGATIDMFGPHIVEAFRGTGLFFQFDEHWSDMEFASGGRFWMVRTVRNDRTWGKALFAANAETPKRRQKRAASLWSRLRLASPGLRRLPATEAPRRRRLGCLGPFSMLRGAVMYGVQALPTRPPARSPRAPARSAAGDKQVLASNIELPLYVREGVEAYMLDNPGHTFRTVVMSGLKAIGIDIDDEDLIPERAMRTPRQREVLPDDTPHTLKPTSIKLPRYVRVRAEEYLLGHPQMRFRHLVMAGFLQLGIHVEAADLIAERQNVLAMR
jgi:hypothetical protein